MRILVSSKWFAKFLNQINFNIDDVDSVRILLGYLYLTISNGEEISFPVESRDNDIEFTQSGVRWESMKKDLSRIQEQPVCIEFGNNFAKYTLKY